MRGDQALRPSITIDIGEMSLSGAMTTPSGAAKFVREIELALAGEMTWRGLVYDASDGAALVSTNTGTSPANVRPPMCTST